MNIILLTLVVVGMAHAQRIPYIPSGGQYPGVLPKYTTTTTINPNDLGNRISGDNNQPSTTGTSQTSDLFPGTLEEAGFVNRVSEWPTEHRPFWFVNREHISNQIGLNQPNKESQVPGAPAQIPFAGNRRPTVQREPEPQRPVFQREPSQQFHYNRRPTGFGDQQWQYNRRQINK